MDTSKNGAAPETAPKPPRKVGRPKGQPHTGGRVADRAKWTSHEVRGELLLRSNAVETLAAVAAGEAILVGAPRTKDEGPGHPVWRYPTMAERIKAAELVLRKCLPDLTAQAIHVDHGKASSPAIDEASARHTARAFLEAIRAETGANTISQDSDEAEVPPTFGAAREAEGAAFGDDAASVISRNGGPAFQATAAPPSEAGGTSSSRAVSSASPSHPEIGERILVGGAGAAIVFERIDPDDQRESWKIEDANGRVRGNCYGRKEAEARAMHLISTGRMTG